MSSSYMVGVLPFSRMVERLKLAALEFLISKQPRGNVRIGAGNTVGSRVSNIFVDVDKFHDQFHAIMEKQSSKRSKVCILECRS
ncbi:hypothetical protein L2E82_20554 [Cichorium intybus]|uniref:Uncharacterized protein n=1 Tax=Cichorium intybus TaxID=13427 RepID=A0ACB9DTC8_CICIN|nr:hypothetical protein L2E82_20554 [Cichorium intybus]